jgi:hypothetical protein
MNFYNQVCFALLSNAENKDKSFAQMHSAYDDLWSDFTREYLRVYRDVHAGEKDETEETLRLVKGRIRRGWFYPRALASHKWMHEIDASTDPGAPKYSYYDIKPRTRQSLGELFDWMFQRLDQEFKDGVYFYCWSRDCDQCESDDVCRFKHWLEAAEWIQSFYDGLEGPGHVQPTTFKHYIHFEQEFRDRRAEQYNY